MSNILNLDCADNGNINNCDDNNLKIAHEYKDYQTILIERQLNIKNNLSVWSPSCVKHCFGQDERLSLSWQVPENSGNNIDLIVKEFMKKEGKIKIELLDKVDWPKND